MFSYQLLFSVKMLLNDAHFNFSELKKNRPLNTRLNTVAGLKETFLLLISRVDECAGKEELMIFVGYTPGLTPFGQNGLVIFKY